MALALPAGLKLKDLTIDNITENVHAINGQCPNPRLKFLLERTVSHLHDLARETRLTFDEWTTALEYLTQVGQISSDVRKEFILLSDVLGLSLLVDAIDHPKPSGSTEGTLLGPFHTHEAEFSDHGDLICHDPNGQPLLVVCNVKDVEGNPISGVKVDTWETDSHGFYDVQHDNRNGPDGRAIMTSDEEGSFWFKAIVPVSYPIPHDGPVGKLLQHLGRHPYRPGHMHFLFEKAGYDSLITALYLRGDPYEFSDAVFGVKSSLTVDIQKVEDEEFAKRYDVQVGMSILKYDFVLVTKEAAAALRHENAVKAMASQGRKVRFINDLPVPSVD